MFFNFKVPKKFPMEAAIFVFISAVNAATVILAPRLSALGYRAWAFFFVNIAYFLLHEPDPKKKFCKLAFGSAFGCGLAWITETLYHSVLSSVFGHAGILLPIVASLACVILLGPFMPIFFNPVTFLYYSASLIVSADAVSNVLPNVAFALLGVLILDGGCYWIIKHYTKKLNL